MSTPVVLERAQLNAAGISSIDTNKYIRRRVYIFPTIQGWLYALMLVVMLLGAINYSNSMAFMLCFLLTSLGIVCMLYTYRNLAGLVITVGKPEPVFAGQYAYFPLQVDNSTGQQRFAISVQEATRNKKHHSKDTHIEFFDVDAGRQDTILYPHLTRRRGLTSLGRITLSSRFPLGIFRAWSSIEPDEAGLVYPRPVGEKRLPLKTIKEEETDYGIGAGIDDFAGFRKYRPGDSINAIAWKAFAREQGLLVKQFSGRGTETLILGWHTVEHLNDIETRLSQLCYWVLLAEELGISYGLSLPGVDIDPGLGEQHKHACMEKLARFGGSHGTN